VSLVPRTFLDVLDVSEPGDCAHDPGRWAR